MKVIEANRVDPGIPGRCLKELEQGILVGGIYIVGKKQMHLPGVLKILENEYIEALAAFKADGSGIEWILLLLGVFVHQQIQFNHILWIFV